MDDLVKFRFVKNDKGRYILTLTFSEHNFSMQDEPIGKEVIAKYGKIITKYSDLYIIMDTRNMKSVAVGLGWNLITDLIKLNDVARKNIKRVAILMINKSIKKYVIDPLLCVYDFVVPTKFFEHNEGAMEYVQS